MSLPLVLKVEIKLTVNDEVFLCICCASPLMACWMHIYSFYQSKVIIVQKIDPFIIQATMLKFVKNAELVEAWLVGAEAGDVGALPSFLGHDNGAPPNVRSS